MLIDAPPSDCLTLRLTHVVRHDYPRGTPSTVYRVRVVDQRTGDTLHALRSLFRRRAQAQHHGREWMDRYTAADTAQRAAMIDAGELARA